MPNGQLFPRAIDPNLEDRETLIEICRLFQMAGTFMAKSILDNRLMDMPLSPLMWDLIFGKPVNIFSLRELGSVYDIFEQLQLMANRVEEINGAAADAETKQQ